MNVFVSGESDAPDCDMRQWFHCALLLLLLLLLL
jgi:hypothetical protein